MLPESSISKLFGFPETTSADPGHLVQLNQGVEKWNAWRRTMLHRPNLVAADLGGPKWNPIDPSEMMRTASQFTEFSDFRNSCERLIEFLKDNISDNFLKVFPEAMAPMSVLDEAAVRRYLKSDASLQYSLNRLGQFGPEKWLSASWAIFSSRDLRRFNFAEGRLNNANLRGADLRECDLSNADLRGADLSWADIRRANLRGSTISHATLRGANCAGADFSDAQISNADLEGTKLQEANLRDVHLNDSNLRDVDLSGALMVRTNLENAILTGARVYGISVWDACLSGTIQTNLVVTPLGQPEITVDSIEIAQFIYLLINNARIRDAIDAISSKAVLILGRFTPERKATLDALRTALRNKNYLPILFDFEKPRHRDFTETISTLAHLSRFVIADLTDPRSIPQELTAIIPRLLSVPICPLLRGTETEWGMFSDLKRFPQVMHPFHYVDDKMLLASLDKDVIARAEQRAQELLS
jgi:uncharacterized protein YjbI with pentapeptide repeats